MNYNMIPTIYSELGTAICVEGDFVKVKTSLGVYIEGRLSEIETLDENVVLWIDDSISIDIKKITLIVKIKELEERN